MSTTAMTTAGSRKAKVVLLDGSTWELIVHAKLLGSELLSTITSGLSLMETQYFGLVYYKEDNQTTVAKQRSRSSTRTFQPQQVHQNHHHQYHHLHHHHHHHHNCRQEWLQLDKKVLEQDVPKCPLELVFYLQIRFYVECVCSLFDILTIEVFYLQARSLISQEVLLCDCDTVFDLASYALQENMGDYISDETTREAIKRLSLLPTNILKVHLSISYCEEQVISRYKSLTGISRGMALLRYMFLVEQQPAYGQHHSEVKDKCGMPWLLGVGPRGLTLFDHNDRQVPRKQYLWQHLSNLYYRERKFTVQMKECKKSNSDQRTSSTTTTTSTAAGKQRHPSSGSQLNTAGGGAAYALTWYCSSALQAKSLWHMAVAQHQFAVAQLAQHSSSQQSQQHCGSSSVGKSSCHNYSVKFISDLAEDISRFGIPQQPRHVSKVAPSLGSLQSLSSRSSSQTSSSMASSTTELSGGQLKLFSDKAEVVENLRHRKALLDLILKQKIEQFQLLCTREAELTGATCCDVTELLALSFPKAGESSCSESQLRGATRSKAVASSCSSISSSSSWSAANISESSFKRLLVPRAGSRFFGSGFSLSSKFFVKNYANTNRPSALDKLELELQSKIQSTAYTLYRETSADKSVQKKRKKSYKEATKKLKELEEKICKMRKQGATIEAVRSAESIRDEVTRDMLYFKPSGDQKPTSMTSLASSATSSSHECATDTAAPKSNGCANRKSACSEMSFSTSSSSSGLVALSSSPASSSTSSLGMTSSLSGQLVMTSGYLPSSVYRTKTHYRSTMYPTIPILSCDSKDPGPRTKSRTDAPVGSLETSTTEIDFPADPPDERSRTAVSSPGKDACWSEKGTAKPADALGSADDESPDCDLDVTITNNGSGSTTLNNSMVSDCFATDAHVTPGGAGRPESACKPSARNFKKNASATTKLKVGPSHLSIYLNGDSSCCTASATSKSNFDICNSSSEKSDSVSKAVLTSSLSNPSWPSSNLGDPTTAATRLLSKEGCVSCASSSTNSINSSTSFSIKTQRQGRAEIQKSIAEINFYDVQAKTVEHYNSRDDLTRTASGKDELKMEDVVAVSTPFSTPTKVVISPRISSSSSGSRRSLNAAPAQLPAPQHIPHLSSGGKQFHKYTLGVAVQESLFGMAPFAVGDKQALQQLQQQFSYAERLEKLRLGSGAAMGMDHRGKVTTQ